MYQLKILKWLFFNFIKKKYFDYFFWKSLKIGSKKKFLKKIKNTDLIKKELSEFEKNFFDPKSYYYILKKLAWDMNIFLNFSKHIVFNTLDPWDRYPFLLNYCFLEKYYYILNLIFIDFGVKNNCTCSHKDKKPFTPNIYHYTNFICIYHNIFDNHAFSDFFKNYFFDLEFYLNEYRHLHGEEFDDSIKSIMNFFYEFYNVHLPDFELQLENAPLKKDSWLINK